MSAAEKAAAETIIYGAMVKTEQMVVDVLAGLVDGSEMIRPLPHVLADAGYTVVDMQPASGGIGQISYLCPSGDPETSEIRL